MVQGFELSDMMAPAERGSFFRGKSPRLWAFGCTQILQGRLLGIISARAVDAELASQSARIVRQTASLSEVSFVSGWHSRLEQEALRVVLERNAALVFCVSKALDRFKPGGALESHLAAGKALLLTHCSPRAKRITREASLRRNELVLALARAVLVLSAPPASSSLQLARSALHAGKVVLTPEHPTNKGLLECGAVTATVESIRNALG